MILIIDTTNADQLLLFLCVGDKCDKKLIVGHNGQLETLLKAIDELLKSRDLILKDLHAIAVNEGPGTFTGLRIGITTANILAWSLDVPVLPFTNTDPRAITSFVYEYLASNDKFSKPVSPKYPNDL